MMKIASDLKIARVGSILSDVIPGFELVIFYQ
jgi:hypothetical protein